MSKLLNRKFREIPDEPWFSDESCESVEFYNKQIRELLATVKELREEYERIVNSDSLATMAEQEEFRIDVFNALTAEIDLRRQVIDLLKEIGRTDWREASNSHQQKLTEVDQEIIGRLEGAGYFAFDKQQHAAGTWTIDMVRRHPARLSVVDAQNQITNWQSSGKAERIRSEQQAIDEAERERQSMKATAVPVL